MKDNEQYSSLFSGAENEFDYEEKKRKKKQKLVRNEFEKCGKYGMPLIKKQNIDLDKINLLSYLKTKNDDKENKDKTIHFFTYDWNFENVYEKPEIALEKFINEITNGCDVFVHNFESSDDAEIYKKVKSFFEKGLLKKILFQNHFYQQ